MKTKAKLFLAKLLILFSIIFIVSGFVLQVKGNKTYDPVDDVRVLAGVSKEEISITTTDGRDVNIPLIGESTGSTNVEVIPPVDGGVGNSVSPSTPNGNTGNNGGSSNNSGSENKPPATGGSTNTPDIKPPITPPPTPTPTPTPTIEETNIQLRNQIERLYGVTVKYGSETSGYSVGGMSTEIIADANACQMALINLNKALSLYPSGFFSEISGYGYPLTFYLIKRYSTNNVTGVTDSSRSRIVISIATDYSFDDTLHHEVYHYIEKYIMSAGARFTSWNSLNPGDFSYGVYNYNYVYTRTFSEDSYFVNTYAESDEYEDRASTFEYMMKSSKASCLNEGKTVWRKAKIMCEQMDYFLNTVRPNVTEYWERYIY